MRKHPSLLTSSVTAGRGSILLLRRQPMLSPTPGHIFGVTYSPACTPIGAGLDGCRLSLRRLWWGALSPPWPLLTDTVRPLKGNCCRQRRRAQSDPSNQAAGEGACGLRSRRRPLLSPTPCRRFSVNALTGAGAVRGGGRTGENIWNSPPKRIEDSGGGLYKRFSLPFALPQGLTQDFVGQV